MRDTQQRRRLRPGTDDVVVAAFVSAVTATIIVAVAFAVIVAFAGTAPAAVVIASVVAVANRSSNGVRRK